MPNLVLGLTQTVEVRYTKCVILCIKDFLDFMTLLFKLSLLSLNGGLRICTAFKKKKMTMGQVSVGYRNTSTSFNQGAMIMEAD